MPEWNTRFDGSDTMLLGGPPPDFSEPWKTITFSPPTIIVPVVANNVGLHVVTMDDSSNGDEKFLAWDRPAALGDDVTDCDQLLLWMTRDATPFFTLATLNCRCSGGVGTEAGYVFRVREVADATLYITEYTGGTPTDLVAVTLTGQDVLIDTWYWSQFRVRGDDLRCRWWLFGGDIPDWQLSTTDTTHTAAGFVGPGFISDKRLDLDFLSLGTQGDNSQFPNLTPVAPSRQNQLVAYPSDVQTDATSFLIYTGEPNVAVEWALTGDGTLTVLTDQTDAAGKAWARYTPGTVGAHNVDVTVGVPV